MANELGSMVVKLGLDSSGLSGGLATAASSLSRFAGSAPGLLGPVGIGLAVVGTVAVGVGIATTKMAGDFQQSITKLYTTAGESKQNLQMVGDGILNMSASVGTGSQKLVEAMYWIESGGLHGAQGLEALRVAAEAAKAENANLDQVSIALAASLNAYAGNGMTAVQVMNTLTAATGQGMMTFEQLSGSLSSVLPASAKFGISLKDVTGALATMTAQGDPASQAATHLKQVILALEAPSKIGAKALASVGLSSEQVAKEMKTSLPDALKMITDAVGKRFPEGSAAYNQAIKNIAGGSKQMMGFLELTGTHMSTFGDNVKKIGGAVKAGGNDLMGWSDIQGNFNFKLDQGKAAIEALGIKLGTALLPMVGQIVSKGTELIVGFTAWETKTHGVENAIAVLGQGLNKLGGFINGVITTGARIISFFQHNQMAGDALKSALIGLGAGLVIFAITQIPVAIVALGGLAVAAWAAIAPLLVVAAPFILIGAVVAVVVFGIIQVVRNWGAITHWLGGVWEAFKGWFIGMIHGIWQNMTEPFRKMGQLFVWLYDHNKYIRLMVDQIKKWLTEAWHFVVGVWENIKTAFKIAGAAITAYVQNAWSAISKVFGDAWSKYIAKPLGDAWKNVTDFIGGWGQKAYDAGSSFIKMLASGITNGVGVIGQAVSGIASTIWKNLGFHSPTKEGILSTSDQWMPNMITMLKVGLETGAPQVGQATQTVAQQIAYPMQSSARSVASVPLQGGGGNQTIEQHTHVYIDSHEIMHDVQTRTDRQVRLKLGPRGRVA